MALADRLVLIEGGRIVQEGTPAEVARHPRTDYVARLVGLNLYRGTARAGAVAIDGTGLTLTTTEKLDGPVFVAFPPTAVALFRSRPDGTPRNVWKTAIAGIESHGDHVRVHLDTPLPTFADITTAATTELDLAPDQPVWAAVKATETHAYPA